MNKGTFVCVSCLLLILLSPGGFAQNPCTFTLSGKVTDSGTKEALPYATLFIQELKKGAMSKDDGTYMITDLCPGTYTITCSHIGCHPVEVTLKIDGNTVQDFDLPHDAHTLDHVVICETQAGEKTANPKSMMKGRAFNEVKGKSLGESLGKIAGVTAMQTGPSISKPIIHGLHSNRILILNNGVRQEGQQWGSEHAPEIDPFIADQFTVVKGASGVRYGSDAIAGVVLVEPKKLPDSAGLAGEVNLVGVDNGKQGTVSAMVEENFKKFTPLSWRLQGTWKRGGNVKAPGYYLKNTGLREMNFSAASGYKKENYGAELFYSQFNTDLGIFSGSHIANLTDLQRAFESKEPLVKSGFSYLIESPYQHIEHELFKAKAFVKTGSHGKLNVTYARQYNQRNEYDAHQSSNTPELKFEITTHSGDLVWDHTLRHMFIGSIGFSGMVQANTYEGRYFIPNFRNYNGGIFLIERWKREKLELEAGIRYDYKQQQIFKWENHILISPVFNYQNFSGSVGGIYSITPVINLYLNAGSAWRAPGVNELFTDGLHHGASAIEKGNRNLLAEKAYNFSTTAEYAGKKLSGQLHAYFTRMDHFIYLAPVQPPTLTVHGAFPTFEYKQAGVNLKGWDAVLNFTLFHGLELASKAAVVRAINKSSGEFIVMMPADRFENKLSYTLKSIRKLSEVYVSAAAVKVMKQWRVPQNSDFAPPPNAYMLLNMETGFTVNLNNQKVECGLGINNLLNTVYRDYLNRFRYFTDEMGRTISIRIKVPFVLKTSEVGNTRKNPLNQ